MGDIDNKCSAVFLTLNPGDTMSNGEQMLPEGKFIKDGAVSCYNEWAKKWVYLNDHSNTFWENRKKWVDRHVNCENVLPFGIELIPYHSKTYAPGGLLKEDITEYIDSNILSIAEQIICNSILKLIICMGKDYGDIFEMLGYEKLLIVNKDNYKSFNISWPLKKEGQPKSREYIVWRSKRGFYYLQIKSGAGFAIPPSKDFKDAEEDIFRLIEEKFKYIVVE